MLKKTELKDEKIVRCLRDEYGLSIEKISFLPLGADRNTSVYRVVTKDKMNYFVKLKKGDFTEASVTIPNFLSALGIKQVIPALTTQTGQLWANLNRFKVILYPFVEGHPAFEGVLSNQHWFEYGTALKRFHTSTIPANMTRRIQTDNFSPRWRKLVKMFLELIEKKTFNELVAMEAVDFLKSKKDEILEIVKRAEQLAQMLPEQSPEFILSHGDIHGWNLLIDNNGALYIVDWDGLIFAPKERDLMFIGGGHGNSGYTPQEEETMFYQGYGHTNINQMALAYYRYERTIKDMVDDCDQILLSDRGGETRREVLEDIRSMFSPNGKVEMANQSDKVFNKSKAVSA
jgi:spectinomycin phosphotransferase